MGRRNSTVEVALAVAGALVLLVAATALANGDSKPAEELVEGRVMFALFMALGGGTALAGIAALVAWLKRESRGWG